jgi:hypothetical protein
MAPITPNDYNSLFSNGIIGEWYLRPDQLELYDKIRTNKKMVINTRRRFGKSTTAFTYIFERCLTEKIVVRCGGITQKSFKDIFNTISESIFDFCPKFRPKYNHEDSCYEFHTGSRLYLFGMADKSEADKARGAKAHIIYCDEYGFWAYRANYMLTAVLSPQLDTTDGILIITSTPPEDLTHDYIQQVSEAALGDYYFVHTIHDSLKCGSMTPELHEQIIKRCGGVHTDTYKREYECMLIASTSRLVIPEAQDESLYRVDTYTRPECFKPYVYMDMGLKDNTGAVFGYVDFINQKLIIEEEYLVSYKTTRYITDNLKKIENTLKYADWTRHPYDSRRCIRQADAQPQQLYDMSNEYKYSVLPIIKAVKGDQSSEGYRETVINSLRVSIGSSKIRIPKHCVNLLKQLKYGIYNEARNDFERTQTLGHLDLLMALAYMNYHIDWKTNPYPNPYDKLNRWDYHVPKNDTKKTLNKIW